MANIRIAIAGAGRMGQALAQSIEAAEDLKLAGVWARGGELADVLDGADVVIDFTLPEANAAVIAAVSERGLPLVCGVSGLSEEQHVAMQDAAAQVPIVFDRNMSQGVNILNDVVGRVAAALGDEFSVEIHEAHHVHKLDSPSGTALKLAESIAAAKGWDAADARIKFEVERRGEVPGDHSIILSSPTERIRLDHSVTTRQVFVEGALRAARWLVGKPAGLYAMHDVLFADK